MAARKSRKGKGKKKGKALSTAVLTKRVRRLELLTGHVVKRKKSKTARHEASLMHGIGI